MTITILEISVTVDGPILPEPSPAPYVIKSDMQRALAEWIEAKIEARAVGQPDPIMPRIVAENIIEICNKLARRPNFNQYTYLDEMIGDAIFDCTKATRNFNREHAAANPFGYFSRVAWNAFVRRIQSEQAIYKLKQDLMFDENYIAYTILDGDDAVLNKNEVRQFLTFGE